jgi:hypothetical protein
MPRPLARYGGQSLARDAARELLVGNWQPIRGAAGEDGSPWIGCIPMTQTLSQRSIQWPSHAVVKCRMRPSHVET